MTPDPAAIFYNLDLQGRQCVVVALSGGSDSTALLLLLRDFLERTGPAVRLLAVTVDHALRPESAQEAEAVGARWRARGIDHRILRWEGAKPGSGLIAAAREARYDLLEKAAAEAGADIVLTGHTLDDQAETVAMRSGRGAGAGIAGMAPETLFDGRLWLVRPLLGVRRQALRNYLAACGEGWVDDPSNENPAFERVRVRAGLADAEVESLAAQAAAAGQERRALSVAAADLIARFATMPAPGLFRLDPDFLRHAAAVPFDHTTAVHALRALLAVAGGTPHLPDLARTQTLAGRADDGPLRATLSRAVVEAHRTGVWIRREARSLPVMQLAEGTALWDGRWRIAAEGGAAGLSVAPLGAERAQGLAAEVAGLPQRLVRAALSAEPALFDGDTFVGMIDGTQAVAHGVSAVRVAGPFARFLPGFDLALAAALMHLLGVPPLPPSPWKHHIAPGP